MTKPPRKRPPRKLPGARFLPARLGPKAAEDEDSRAAGDGSGLTLRAMLPNAITAAALCAGLTGIRFAIDGQWAFAIGLVVLALVVVVGVAIFLLTFDPNAYKYKLEELVQERYHRTLTIDGEIELSLFPRIGLSVQGDGCCRRMLTRPRGHIPVKPRPAPSGSAQKCRPGSKSVRP